MKHDFHERDDGLAHCKVCGGAEASLPTECPGVRMTESQQDLVQWGDLDYSLGRWVMPGQMVSVDRERATFEASAYAFYLKQRAAGRPLFLDAGDRQVPREELFQRDDNGNYRLIVYQAAWGGWQLARGIV